MVYHITLRNLEINMKVLLPISYFNRKRGPGQAAVGLARGLSHFTDVTILTYDSEVDLEEFKVYEDLKPPSIYHLPYNSLKIKKFSKDKDIIYLPVSVGIISTAYLTNPLKKMVGGPNVNHNFERKMLLDHFITHGEHRRQQFIEGHNLSPDKVSAIGLPVESDIYNPERNDKEILNYKKEGFINILYAGRLHEKKGSLNLTKAFNELSGKYDAKLHICGKGPQQEQIEKYAEKCNNIHYHGFVSDERLANLYASVDIGCFPSRWEGFGLVYLECMASETATIGVDTSGPKEIMTHRGDGYLLEDNSIGSIENGLTELIENEELRDKLARNGKNTALTDYSPKNIASKLYRIFQDVLGLR
ncbi:MAG: glycosyltransferase family 4 protein [Thermoplasmatota archaeon]